MFSAGAAKLLQLKTSLDRLLVLARVVVHLAALRALEFDEVVL